MTLIGFVHKLNVFSQPDAKNGAGWRCATEHADHHLWPEVGPTTVTMNTVLLSDTHAPSLHSRSLP